MKKNSTAAKKSQKTRTERVRVKKIASEQKLTIGMDLGDCSSHYCVLDENGEVISRSQVATMPAGMKPVFGKMAPCLIVMEVGTHSAWVSRLLASYGHEVIVANARRVKLIGQSQRKNDRVDAETLARLGRADRKLLSPIQHRGEEAQWDLAMIRARAEIVEARTAVMNCARGLMKAMGERLPRRDVDGVEETLSKGLSEAAQKVAKPLLKSVAAMTEQIHACDQEIQRIAAKYPEVELLQQVNGVGPLIGLTFVLILEDPQRFKRSRDVGPYLGLVPAQRDSGKSQPQLRISKSGDKLLRSLLVQGAHCILRKGAPDSDLRQWGLEKQKEGGKKGKRRAIVGVARRLAVLLHHLWVNGEVYEPLYNNQQRVQAKKAA
jgi:transposase